MVRQFLCPGIVSLIFLVLPNSFISGTARAATFYPGVSPTNLPWPGGIIPYEFDLSVSPAQRTPYLGGLKEWELAGNIQLTPRSGEANYLLLTYDPFAPQNMVGGTMPVTMTLNVLTRAQTAHEMAHAIGFQHEQVRSDRNTFIDVFTNNIVPSALSFFNVCTNCPTFGTYDFTSIVHFTAELFSTAPGILNTMEPKPPNGFLLPKLNNIALSRGDREAAAHLYGPGPTLTSIVTNTADGGPGSLRAAIYYAMDNPGTTITFNISTNDPGFANGVYTIHLTGHLPVLATEGTGIDGTTQPGYAGSPLVELSGAQIAPEAGSVYGLLVYAANCRIRGLCIRDFQDSGILIEYPEAFSNVVEACYVGVDATGANAAPNGFQGVGLFKGTHHNTIGGTAASSPNLISGNVQYGVLMVDSNTEQNHVIGNVIGLRETSSAGAVPNGLGGVGIFGGASGNFVGGWDANGGNVISGNNGYGVSVIGAGTSNNVVRYNVAGLSAGGGLLPNTRSGVGVFGGATSNRIGPGNTLSGNQEYGALLNDPGTEFNELVGNEIGISGGLAAPNGFAGVLLANGSTRNTIGGTNAADANIISGNSGAGIFIADSNTAENIIAGNRIGTDAAGNDGSLGNNFEGIVIVNGAHDQVVGLDRQGAGAGNRIAYNGTIGIFLFDTAGAGNTIRGNEIFSNDFLGIDLGGGTNIGFGVTANDPEDPDGGPNALQNYPVLTNTVIWGPATTLQGTLQSKANRSYVIDFYRSAIPDSSGYGEGEIHLGATTADTDGSGTASFSFGVDGAFSNQNITVTATDLTTGDTSEFGASSIAGTAIAGPEPPAVTQIQPTGAGEAVIQVAVDPGWRHRLQVTTNMHSWIDTQGFIGADQVVELNEPSSTGALLRAFRVVSP
jgi:hypothetical protein